MERSLRREPYGAVVSALEAAAKRQVAWNAYARVANMLGRLGGGAALSALEREALGVSAYRIHAVRALADSRDPEAVEALFRLFAEGRASVRRAAAMALAERKPARAAETMLRFLRSHRGGARAPVLRAVRALGKPHELIEMLMADETIGVAARVDALETIETHRREIGRVRVERVFERLARARAAGVASVAREAADLYRARRTLLRPSERAPGETLVRPARGVGHVPTDRLLRPATGADDAETGPRAEGLVSGILRRLKEAFDGD
jgi:HEAT repeat protein